MESVFLWVCSLLIGLSLINKGKFSLVGHTGCKVAKKLIPLYNKLYFVADFGDMGIFRSCSVGVFTFDDTQGKFSLIGVGSGGLC